MLTILLAAAAMASAPAPDAAPAATCPAPKLHREWGQGPRYCDPVHTSVYGVSATPREATFPSLRPDVTCADRVCRFRLKGWTGRDTAVSATFPYTATGYRDGDDWMPVPMEFAEHAAADLADPYAAPYGWRLGFEEGQIEVVVRPMTGSAPDAFVVAVTGGWEHVKTHWYVMRIVPAWEGARAHVAIVKDWPPVMGPFTTRLEPDADGVTYTVTPWDETLIEDNNLAPREERWVWDGAGLVGE